MSRVHQLLHFSRHLIEMCIPMCIGFMVGDAAYFAIAGAAGYGEPFRELPVLSVLVVTFAMTAPMVAWMRYRGMASRQITEMAGSMVVLAAALLVAGWSGAIAQADMALAEHGLMMPAMGLAMLLHVDAYTGRARVRA